jgi:hypothetical protein
MNDSNEEKIDHSEFLNVSLWVIRWLLCLPLGAVCGLVCALLISLVSRIYGGDEDGFLFRMWGDFIQGVLAGTVSAWVCGWTAPHSKHVAVSIFTVGLVLFFGSNFPREISAHAWRPVIFQVICAASAAWVTVMAWKGELKFKGNELSEAT